MPLPKKTPRPRRSLLARVVNGLWIMAVVATGLALVAVFVVDQVGKALAALALGTMLAEFAAFATFVAQLAAVLVVLAVMTLLQTPPLLGPFDPIARLAWAGVSAWVALWRP